MNAPEDKKAARSFDKSVRALILKGHSIDKAVAVTRDAMRREARRKEGKSQK